MKNGLCPKCNSTEIYRGTTTSTFTAGGGWVHLETHKPASNLFLDPYVCTNCGYVEMYVANQSTNNVPKLAEDKEFWEKVNAS